MTSVLLERPKSHVPFTFQPGFQDVFRKLFDGKQALSQPRPQGLLSFQYGGGRRLDPGTQQKSREWFVHGEWKFIQKGGQAKEWEDLGTRSWDPVKNKQNGGRGKLKEAKNMNECTYKPQEYGRMI